MGNKRTPEIYFRYCWGVANPLTDPPEWVELIFIPSWSSLGLYKRLGDMPPRMPILDVGDGTNADAESPS